MSVGKLRINVQCYWYWFFCHIGVIKDCIKILTILHQLIIFQNSELSAYEGTLSNICIRCLQDEMQYRIRLSVNSWCNSTIKQASVKSPSLINSLITFWLVGVTTSLLLLSICTGKYEQTRCTAAIGICQNSFTLRHFRLQLASWYRAVRRES